MARIAGTDIPKNKVIKIALTYIYGIGPHSAMNIINRVKIDPLKRAKDLSEDDLLKIRAVISESYQIEGDLRRKISQDIRRLKEVNSYKGQRHKMNLPVRGQKTKTNARTKRGKRIAVAGKKKAV